MAYKREDLYDGQVTAEIAKHYREILRLLGEDPDREGLVKTPERVGACQDSREGGEGAPVPHEGIRAGRL